MSLRLKLEQSFNQLDDLVLDLFRYINYSLPLAILISSFVITGFFFRFAFSYKHSYITARQTITPESTLLSIAPIILLCIFGFNSENSYLYAFCIISSILSVAYPLIIGSRLIALATLFPTALLFSCLVERCSGYVYLFLPSIVLSYFKFRDERKSLTAVHRFLFAPYLLLFFISFYVSNDYAIYTKLKTYASLLGIVGAFIGLLFEKIFLN